MFPTSADYKRPNSDKPAFGCKRGRERCGAAHHPTISGIAL
jgi:hypothetical protein